MKKTKTTRSRNKNKCDYTIKSLVSSCGHKKCHSGSHKSVRIVGKQLNSFLNMNSSAGKNVTISGRKQVTVCYTLMLLIKKHERNGATSNNSNPTPELQGSTSVHQSSSSSSPTTRSNNFKKGS